MTLVDVALHDVHFATKAKMINLSFSNLTGNNERSSSLALLFHHILYLIHFSV